MTTSPIKETECDKCESAQVEYAATNDAYMHYDNFSWQVGTVLIAGVFVFWGFLLDKNPQLDVLVAANLLVCSLMSIWLLYTAHNRQIYLFKLHRIHELEKFLGMRQHRRFKDWENDEPRLYKLGSKIVGHNLDDSIYIVSSLGGPILGWFNHGFDPWLALPLPIVLLVVGYVRHMDKRAKDIIMQLPV